MILSISKETFSEILKEINICGNNKNGAINHV